MSSKFPGPFLSKTLGKNPLTPLPRHSRPPGYHTTQKVSLRIDQLQCPRGSLRFVTLKKILMIAPLAICVANTLQSFPKDAPCLQLAPVSRMIVSCVLHFALMKRKQIDVKNSYARKCVDTSQVQGARKSQDHGCSGETCAANVHKVSRKKTS